MPIASPVVPLASLMSFMLRFRPPWQQGTRRTPSGHLRRCGQPESERDARTGLPASWGCAGVGVAVRARDRDHAGTGCGVGPAEVLRARAATCGHLSRRPAASDRKLQGDAVTMYRANGTQINKTQATAPATAVPVTDPIVKITEHIYEGVRPDGTDYPPARRRLKFRKDQIIRTSELNACFPAPTIKAISPATGAAAGHTFVTIKVTNATPGTTVTFGGARTPRTRPPRLGRAAGRPGRAGRRRRGR
ncbi:IPT/TIG domain-containing protein [Nonomuraea sp. KM90]|uniref:IPT/TIG domain-containing protein n=1 Tax=Nonomuraea sp. KM90 TaxID=3457428 RepID=UPI003FCEB8D4